jgi:hypothetical protein
VPNGWVIRDETRLTRGRMHDARPSGGEIYHANLPDPRVGGRLGSGAGGDEAGDDIGRCLPVVRSRLGEPSSSFHIYMTQRQPGMLSASALRLIQPGIRWRSFVRHYWLRRRFGNPATARRTWWMALLA